MESNIKREIVKEALGERDGIKEKRNMTNNALHPDSIERGKKRKTKAARESPDPTAS